MTTILRVSPIIRIFILIYFFTVAYISVPHPTEPYKFDRSYARIRYYCRFTVHLFLLPSFFHCTHPYMLETENTTHVIRVGRSNSTIKTVIQKILLTSHTGQHHIFLLALAIMPVMDSAVAIHLKYSIQYIISLC